MSKPAPLRIRNPPPLTRDRLVYAGVDPLSVCNLCGKPPSDDLPLACYRECDEKDRPIAGDGALVFVALGHKECLRRLEKHPLLYKEERGNPGHFPRLCGPCVARKGTRCSHPKLKANGGDGLRIRMDGVSAIICGRGGCRTMLQHAVRCEGLVLLTIEDHKEGGA